MESNKVGQEKPKLILLTGPQGSGNHMWSKLFAMHPVVTGWVMQNYWEGHHEEPFAEYWDNPDKLKEFQIPEKADYQKHPNPASRYAIIGVFVAKHKKDVNVAVTGAKSCVYIDKDLSKKLSNNFSSSAIQNMELDSSEMNSDIHASAEYRASLVVTQAKKAVDAC